MMTKIKSYIITLPEPEPLMLMPWAIDPETKKVVTDLLVNRPVLDTLRPSDAPTSPPSQGELEQ